MTIRDWINKIKWDKNLEPTDYYIHFYDRVSKTIEVFRFVDILEDDGFAVKIRFDYDEIVVPIHRIRKITNKKGETLFAR